MTEWPLQDAKNRFSAVVNAVARGPGGPHPGSVRAARSAVAAGCEWEGRRPGQYPPLRCDHLQPRRSLALSGSRSAATAVTELTIRPTPLPALLAPDPNRIRTCPGPAGRGTRSLAQFRAREESWIVPIRQRSVRPSATPGLHSVAPLTTDSHTGKHRESQRPPSRGVRPAYPCVISRS